MLLGLHTIPAFGQVLIHLYCYSKLPKYEVLGPMNDFVKTAK